MQASLSSSVVIIFTSLEGRAARPAASSVQALQYSGVVNVQHLRAHLPRHNTTETCGSKFPSIASLAVNILV